MTQPEQQVWAAPNKVDLVSTAVPNALIRNEKRDTGGIGKGVLLVGTAALASGILIANCAGSDDEINSTPVTSAENDAPIVDEVEDNIIDITESDEYKALESKYNEEISELEEELEQLRSMIKDNGTEESTDDEESSSEETATDTTLESEVADQTVAELIKKNIDEMTSDELQEMYGLIDNPEWSENAREVGLIEVVNHENMVDMLRHDRDVLGQVAGCFAYAEYTSANVNNLGEICAGPDMEQPVQDVMNAEIQRLLNADLREVAFTAEMVIAKLHGGQLTSEVAELYELTSYTGNYNTTRLENRRDTIEGSTNYREDDTWITFNTVTLANGKTYKISFRACGQIVVPVTTPETPPKNPPVPPEEPPTPPEEPPTPPEEPPTPPEEPPKDHDPVVGPPPVVVIPAQPTDPTPGYEPGSAEENEGSQGTIEDGEPAPNNGEPTVNGTQIEDTAGTGAEGPTVGENGDGVTEQPDPVDADENPTFDPETEVSEGQEGGNANPDETEADDDVNNSDPGGF